MKGLLLKDFLSMRSYLAGCMAVLLGLMFLMNLLAAQGAAGFTIGCSAIVGGMMGPASFSYDRKSGWDEYALTLPYTKKQIVCSKYLFSLLTMGACILVGVLFCLIFMAAGRDVFETDSMKTALFLICGTVITLGLTLPLIYRLGVEEGQVVVVLVGVATIMLLGRCFLGLQNTSFHAVLDVIVVLLPLIAVCVLIFSYLIACKIYETKDAPIRKLHQMPLPAIRKK